MPRRPVRHLTQRLTALVAIATLATLVATAPRSAEATSTSGTDFWVAFFRNVNTPTALDLFITGPTSTSGTVSGAPLDADIPFTVTAGQVTTVKLPIAARVTASSSGTVLDIGIRITAGAPVTVYGINQAPATTDGFLAIPVEALGTRYRVATLNGGYFAVVATRDGTTVSVNGTAVGTLSAGQVYYSEPGGNPTGTLVTANHPVSVFAGHPCSNEPGLACDHLVEQLPPTDAWGSDFITMRYADESDATNLFVVVADQDGTVVSVDGTELVTLNAGERNQFRLFARDGGAMITGGRITATKPVLLLQFMQYGTYRTLGGTTTTGDPAMSVIPPFEQFQTSYTLATMAGGFAFNAVNVVIPTAAVASFRLNGATVADGAFVALGATGFSGAQLGIDPGTYNLVASQPFGVFLYGANPADSYAVPGGMSLSPVALISNLALSGAVTTGTLNGNPSVCFSATVADGSSNPLEGIRVDFAITGELAESGAATTAANGVATFCIENTSSTGGTVNATATAASLSDARALTVPIAGQSVETSGGSEPPNNGSVSVAVEQAVGLSGASSVLVRDSVPVPVTTTVDRSAGPRGSLVIASEDLTVTVTTSAGADETAGVVVATNGEVVCEICARLAAGSIVEAWVYSVPRLAAAVRVEVEAEEGTCPLLRIPVGAPLDGNGAIEAGVHTVQLRMYTGNGFEVLAFPVTVGGPVPSSIPAGKEPALIHDLALPGLVALTVAGARVARRRPRGAALT